MKSVCKKKIKKVTTSNMKAKEPAVRYNTMPSISVMRGKLIEVFEHENDANFIQSMYVFMIQTRNEQEAEKNTKHLNLRASLLLVMAMRTKCRMKICAKHI